MKENQKNIFCKKIGIDCKYITYCNENISFKFEFKEHIKKLMRINWDFLIFRLLKNRKVMKQEFIDINEIPSLITKYNPKGEFELFIYNQKGGLYPELWKDKNKFAIILCKTKEDLINFLKFDIADKFHEKCGFSLGYPVCCIDRYIKEKTNPLHLDFRWKRELFSKGLCCPLINPNFNFFLHRPCSKKCKNTIKIAQAALDFISIKLGTNFVMAYFYYMFKEQGEIESNFSKKIMKMD